MDNQGLQTMIDDTVDRAIQNINSVISPGTDIGTVRTIKSLVSAIIVGVNDMLQDDVELKVMRTVDAKEFPLIATKKDGDVGFDLPAVFPLIPMFNGQARESRVVNPGERVVIPTGIHLELPRGYWASIEARSSTSKQMLICPKGVIDEGYRGELFAVLLNVGSEPVQIHHGDRYVQLIIHKRESSHIRVVEVDELSPSERGDTGFGSTGQNEVAKG